MRVEERLRTFEDLPHTRGKGALGEDVGIEILRDLGYEALERNVSVPGAEIDLVARHGECLCFVEIKFRATDEFGTALEAVTPRKRSRLVRAATAYLAFHDLWETLCRFDVLAVDQTDEGWQVTLIQDAFTADGLT